MQFRFDNHPENGCDSVGMCTSISEYHLFAIFVAIDFTPIFRGVLNNLHIYDYYLKPTSVTLLKSIEKIMVKYLNQEILFSMCHFGSTCSKI